MKSLEPGYLERLPITHETLRSVRLIGEYRGKEALFQQQSPQLLQTLRQVAVIPSTESSNRIEGVTAPLKRIQELVAEKTTPRNRSEQEIAGYRDVLNTVHARHVELPFAPGAIRQLHRDLFKYVPAGDGEWKAVDNRIETIHPDGRRELRFRPVRAEETPAAMGALHHEFERRWESDEIDRLLLIAAYVLDFLCIHAFPDGNGQMARLLTLLLLYRAGYEVGRYIGLEKVVEASKASYYDSLHASSHGWHEGRHDLRPWTGYFLGVLLAAYREFEQRVGDLTAPRGAAGRASSDSVDTPEAAWYNRAA